jgi:putative ABC transport system permease protein
MSPIRRLWNVIRRRHLDDELRQEVDTHLALIEEEERAGGASEGAARRLARERFGSALIHRERALDTVIMTSVESAWKETAFAARRLLRSPAFTLAAVLTLALAIGANAAIFGVVERVLLNPLPYPDSDRLLDLDHGAHRLNLPSGMGITRGYYFQYLERARTLEGIALFNSGDETITGDGDPARIRVTRATTSLAPVLRVWPETGRWFTDDEGKPGAPLRVVLSHGLWMRRYGGDPHIVGRSITFSGVQAEVIGVMPASFAFPDARVEAWLPQQITRSMGFGIWLYAAVARMRDGVTVEQVRTELNPLIADIEHAFPGDSFAVGNSEGIGVVSTARTIKEATIGGIAAALWMVLASVAVVLLVACANVANLFLVRSESRQREVAVRLALGAGRAGIARYFMAESVLLSVTGGAVGLALAWGAVRLLVSTGPATLPRLGEIRLDGLAVAYTLLLSVVSAVAFGAIPLLHGAPLASTLNEGGRGNTTGRGRHRARRFLLGAQVAMALVLLIASGLMVRSFQKLRDVNLGFNPASTLVFNVALPATAYPSRASAVAVHHQVLDRLSVIPGVTAASASTCLPLSGGCFGNTMLVRGRPQLPNVTPPPVVFRAVAGGYFETMGIRVVRGRTITRGDVDRHESIVVISEAMARRVFPGEDPLGQYLFSSAPPRSDGTPSTPPLEIVGIVADTSTQSLAEPNPALQLYMPMSIAGGPDFPPITLLGPDVSIMNFIVRSSVVPTALAASVRRAVDAVDPKLAIARVTTLQAIVDRASAQMAFTMVMIAIAGVVSLLLGIVGIYGVMSYIVSQRRSEIGVRLALGAEPRSVAAMILKQGGAVALAGSAIGVVVALAGSRLIASLLYGITPRDPSVFIGTTLVLLIVSALACWIPARRAARLSPLEALRVD